MFSKDEIHLESLRSGAGQNPKIRSYLSDPRAKNRFFNRLESVDPDGGLLPRMKEREEAGEKHRRR